MERWAIRLLLYRRMERPQRVWKDWASLPVMVAPPVLLYGFAVILAHNTHPIAHLQAIQILPILFDYCDAVLHDPVPCHHPCAGTGGDTSHLEIV